MRRMPLNLYSLCAAAACLLLMPPAHAAGNTKAAQEKECAKLTAEIQQMIELGAKRSMDKGADWAKLNLSATDLAMIQHFIEASERFKFRCVPPEALARLKIDDLADDASDGESAPSPQPNDEPDNGTNND
jgi:hypothetical protein